MTKNHLAENHPSLSTLSTPNTVSTTGTWRRRRTGAFIAAPIVAFAVACGANPVFSSEVSSDELAATMAEKCPVDDKFELKQATIVLADSMEAPAPVGEKQRQLYAQNLYNAKTPGATESVQVVGGVDSRTGASIDASLVYDLSGEVVEAKTAGGETVCALQANFNQYVPPTTTTA